MWSIWSVITLNRSLTPAPATIEQVWRSLVKEMPALSDYERTMSVALNTDYSKMTAAVKDGDEVAFLPPVSGG